METGLATTIRPPAVAGLFYPAREEDLRHEVHALMNDGRQLVSPGDQEAAPQPRALIVPHAGYAFSGAIAGAAYSLVDGSSTPIERVVLLGPSHFVPIDQVVLPAASALETPLGVVPVDPAMREEALAQPGVQAAAPPHEREHSLEVHLPFLQETLGRFELLPILVGDKVPEAAANLVQRFWDERTLIVVSTDLSHFLDEDSARAKDGETARMIEALEAEEIGPDRACGAFAVQSLIRVLRRCEGTVARVAQGTSADVTGDTSRVVGYGSWLVH